MTTLFINGSPNKHGNTVVLAQKLLNNQAYETLHLADYKIYDYGQHFADDQFDEMLQKVFFCRYHCDWFSSLLAQYQWTGP